MLNEFYRQFKSGTDIRGVATEGVKGQPVNLTDDVIENMADGFVLWLSEKVGKQPSELKISVGRDSRISGPHIMALTTENGWVFSDEELKTWLAETGFKPGDARPVPPPMPHWLLCAERV